MVLVDDVAQRCVLQGYPISVEEKMRLYTSLHLSGNHRIAKCSPRVVTALGGCGRTYRDRADACFETFAAACLIHAALPVEVVRMIVPLRTTVDPRVPRLVKAVYRNSAAADVVRRHVASKRSNHGDGERQLRGKRQRCS